MIKQLSKVIILVFIYGSLSAKKKNEDKLSHFDARNSITTKLSFDEENNIIIKLKITDKVTYNKIFLRGLNFYFSTEGKKKKDIFFQYPLTQEFGSLLTDMEEFPENGILPPYKLDYFLKNIQKEAVFGKLGRIERIPLSYTNSGVEVSFTKEEIEDNIIVNYTAVVPFKKISDKKPADLSVLRLGIVTPGYEKKIDIQTQVNVTQPITPTQTIPSYYIDAIEYWIKFELK